MSRRRGNNNIRGPQSALTSFLAANNISAAQIRDDYEQRLRNAELQNTSNEDVEAAAALAAVLDAEEAEAEAVAEASRSSSKKRKRFDGKAKGKKLKKSKKPNSDDALSENSEDELPSMYAKSTPLPGQLENCDICNKRFTVTPYSKTGPDGGLLCTPCGKELKTAEKKKDNAAKKAAPGKKRRKAESNRLDGIVTQGAKTLQQLCIEKVADHHLDIEEFGDLPESVLDRLSEIFSKRRVMNPRTLGFFLRPDLDSVSIHDAANLMEDDYKQIFAVVPGIEKLVLRNASQFKDSALSYMMEKTQNIRHFQVYGANLVSDGMWQSFFEEYGRKLETLMLQWLDATFDDEIVESLVRNCTHLRRLKLKYCRRITALSLITLGGLQSLEHLSIHFSHPVESEQIVPLITALGPNLKTLSLENCPDGDDAIVDAIRTHCTQLKKLRLSENDCVTDAAFTSLFSKWANPGLTFVDLSSTRDIDNNNPDGPLENPIGLAGSAFKALMTHSGSHIERLNIASCRHIPHATFCDVFDGHASYSALQEINLSFCNSVDTFIISNIFKCCPKLKKLIAFGCFKVEDLTVPKGIALIGVPRAQDAIEQFGDAVVDVGKAGTMMIEVGA